LRAVVARASIGDERQGRHRLARILRTISQEHDTTTSSSSILAAVCGSLIAFGLIGCESDGVVQTETDPVVFEGDEEAELLTDEAMRLVNLDMDDAQAVLELRDEEGKRRRLKYVKGANRYTFVGETPPDDLDAWKFEAGTTKTMVTHTFSQRVQPGAKVWLAAIYFNLRMQTGYACDPVSTYTTGGAMSRAA
jgi:hypothetical protein